MKGGKKILILWLILVVIMRLLLLFPHAKLDTIGQINTSIQILLCLLAFKIAKESYGRQKFIYYNFAALFSICTLLITNSFIGYSLFTENIYANMFFRIYFNKFTLNLIWLFTFSFITIDFFLPSLKTFSKYILGVSISALVVALLFFKILLNPFQMYYEKDYTTLLQIVKINKDYQAKNNREANEIDIAGALVKTNEKDNAFDEKIMEAKRLIPFQKEGGMTTIFWKPLDINFIYVNIMSLLFIISILIYSMIRNNSYGAYTDKVLMIMLLISALEIFHYHAFMNSYSKEVYQVLFVTGQYVTIIFFLILVYAFDLRLKFVLSAAGKYYEKTIENNAEEVTRWRDELDNLILKTFTKNKNHLKQIGITKITQFKTKE